MAARVFVIWSLILVTVWMGVFGFFDKYFDGADYERARVIALQQKIRRDGHLLALANFKFSEYKDALAFQGIKIKDSTPWADPTRAIASVMADSDYQDLPQPQPGTPLFIKAKSLFSAGDYKRSSELFDDFVSQYADHPSLPEAAYLLEESFYQTAQIDRSINTIDFLTTHFPETEFAGYALVRLGKIFEDQDRTDEAAEIFSLVVKNFSKSNAARLATRMLARVQP